MATRGRRQDYNAGLHRKVSYSIAGFLNLYNMQNKFLDTIFTAFTSVCSIQLFSSLEDIQVVYSMFVQSLVATAAIAKILYDFSQRKAK